MRQLVMILIMLWIANSAAAAELPAWKARLLPEGDAWRETEQHFVFNNGTEPETLDPALITGVPESRIVDALFEGLISLDPETLEPRPGVAASWSISADQLSYTFNLRANAKWSDGSPVTSQDFMASWERVLTPTTAAAYAYQLYPVKNAEAFNRGDIAEFAEVGATAPDARTFVVTLERPCPYFLDLVAFHTLFPTPTAVIKQHGDRWVRKDNIVNNGPFVLSEWLPEQRIELTGNPHYWDRKHVTLKKITVSPQTELNVAFNLFKKKQLHWLPALPLARIEEAQRDPDYYVMPYLGVYFYRFNCTKPPFNDARVRQAFVLVINRELITSHILKGGQEPATWFCPPAGGYKHVAGLAYDPEKAVALLAEAGYGQNGKPFPEVELLYNTSEGHKAVAEALSQQWKNNLGAQISLHNSEWKVFLSDMNQLNYQIARSSWIGDYNDPNTFFDMWVSDGGNNRTGWSSKPYDELLQQAANEPDKATRFALFQDMERILVEQEMPILPLYIYVNQGLLAEQVLGWYDNVRDYHPLKYIWLER